MLEYLYKVNAIISISFSSPSILLRVLCDNFVWSFLHSLDFFLSNVLSVKYFVQLYVYSAVQSTLLIIHYYSSILTIILAGNPFSRFITTTDHGCCLHEV